MKRSETLDTEKQIQLQIEVRNAMSLWTPPAMRFARVMASLCLCASYCRALINTTRLVSFASRLGEPLLCQMSSTPHGGVVNHLHTMTNLPGFRPHSITSDIKLSHQIYQLYDISDFHRLLSNKFRFQSTEL